MDATRAKLKPYGHARVETEYEQQGPKSEQQRLKKIYMQRREAAAGKLAKWAVSIATIERLVIQIASQHTSYSSSHYLLYLVPYRACYYSPFLQSHTQLYLVWGNHCDSNLATTTNPLNSYSQCNPILVLQPQDVAMSFAALKITSYSSLRCYNVVHYYQL